MIVLLYFQSVDIIPKYVLDMEDIISISYTQKGIRMFLREYSVSEKRVLEIMYRILSFLSMSDCFGYEDRKISYTWFELWLRIGQYYTPLAKVDCDVKKYTLDNSDGSVTHSDGVTFKYIAPP